MIRLFKYLLRYHREHPLAFRLLVNIIICSSIITLLATALQLYLDFKRDVNQIDKHIQQIGNSYIKGITLTLWNINEHQIRSLMEGILKFPDIEYVEVRSDIQLKIPEATKEKNIMTREFPLIMVDDTVNNGTGEFLGTLIVAASLENVYKRLKEKVLVILGSQAVKTFIVSLFILFIVRFLVTRHLNTMVQFAGQLDLGHLDEKLDFKRNRKAHKRKDELDRVESAVNNMLHNLKKSSEEMKVRSRMEGELNAAAVLQRSFSPEKAPDIEGFGVSSMFLPARELSGDYYDFIQLNDSSVAFVVADVSGKGVSAALYANIARVLLREKANHYDSPVEVLKALNRSLKKEFHTNHFLTMSYVHLDVETSTVTYSSAGHEPVVLVEPDCQGFSLLKPKGYPFGELYSDMFDQRIREEHYQMMPGDLIFLYSDGLTDVENEDGDMFGEERLYQLIRNNRDLSPEELKGEILNTIVTFQGSADQTDDITMILLKKHKGDRHAATKRAK